MAYMDFLDALEKKVDAEGNAFLTDLLNRLEPADVELNGTVYSVRRISDEYIGSGRGKVKTGFFCFPENGAKDRMFQGGAFYAASDIIGIKGRQAELGSPKIIEYRMPARQVVYYGMVAHKAQRLLRAAGANSFLFHDVMITTPEGRMEPLDTFDFSKHRLFMLGLYGNEYKVGIREKE